MMEFVKKIIKKVVISVFVSQDSKERIVKVKIVLMNHKYLEYLKTFYSS